ncbi:putative transposase/invertase (TIGR01784 family) [Halomonas sp. A11-A]|nr:putative transposase/invertase (TIGR01784 family) [Halomonas sp. A11-A]
MLAERIKKWPERWIEEGRQEGRQEALHEAEARVLETKRETARNLIKLGVLNDEQIAQATGLMVEDVVRLRAESRH